MSEKALPPPPAGEVPASDAGGGVMSPSFVAPSDPSDRDNAATSPADRGGTENPEPITARDIADVLQAAVAKAKEGDMFGAEVVRRFWCRRRETVVLDIGEVRTADQIAAAQGKVVALTFAGSLTPREGRDVSTMIENRRKALHTLEQQRQLDDILEFARQQAPGKKGPR
jgi:hypothetical protein